MRRLFRFAGYGLSALALAVIVLAGATARPADPALWPPKPGEPATEIFVVSHGYHSGIAVSTAQLAAAAQRSGDVALILIAEQFGSYPFIEVGWGEERFYASVPTPASLSLGIVVRALFQPGNRSVLHVVGLPDHPRKVFASADMVRVPLSERGFGRMLSALDTSVAMGGDPPTLQVLGRGLYGPSLFFRANGAFHIFNVCNHWVGDMLAAAGLPVTPVLDTVPAGLLLDLKWRAGLDRLPGPQP
jgi:uncharacterized protein (TIGR02117 family)